MDKKWHQHDIMVVIRRKLHNSWKGVVAIELQWIILYMYIVSCKANYKTSFFFHNVHTYVAYDINKLS
jgi:hypothetical protein